MHNNLTWGGAKARRGALRDWLGAYRRPILGAVTMLAIGLGGPSWGSGQAAIKVKAGIIPTMSAAPLVLGVHKGFFSAEGLDVTTEVVQSAAAAVPALLNGDLQFLESSTAPTLAALANKVPVKVVGNETIMNDAQATLLVAADGPKSLSDLAGKPVAVNALKGFLQLAVQSSVDKAGGDSNAIKFIELPFANMIGALKAGSVAAIAVTEPLSTIGQMQGLRVLSQVWHGVPEHAAAGWQLTSASYAAKEPEVVAKFQRALKKSVTYASQHPEEARSIAQTYIKVDPAILQKITIPVYVPEVSVQATEDLATLMKKYGYIKDGLPANWLIK
jgi:NitT/TauT family transport system substrate-binding protein